MVERVARYASRFGPPALRAVERSPARMIRALDGLPPDLVAPALRAAAREPELTARLVGEYGKGALEITALRPGVGASLVEKLGADGITIGRKLTTDQAVTLARYADDIAALPPGERNQLLNAMTQAPVKVLDYLESHPKVLFTAGGVAAIVAAKDNLLGRPAPATTQETPPAGLVERVISGIGDRFAAPLKVVVVILVGGILCRVVIGLRSMWRLRAIRLRMEEERLAAEMLRLPRVQRRNPRR